MSALSRTRRAWHWAVLAGLALVLVWPAPASAHAVLVSTDPADGSVVAAAPTNIRVEFNEPISLPPAGNELLDASGKGVPVDVAVQNNALVLTPRSALGDGSYVVAYRVVSADTHPVSGGFTFSVGVPSATTVSVPTGQEQRELTIVRVSLEALRYAGLLAVAGLVVFVELVAAPGVRADRAAMTTLLGVLSASALAAAAGQLLLTPLNVLWEGGSPLSGFVSWRTWADGFSGIGGVTFAMVAAGGGVAVVGARRDRPVLAVTGAATAMASLILVGHTRSYGPPWLVLVSDLVHVSSGAIWWGGLIGLSVVWSDRFSLRAVVKASTLSRFSTLAAVTVVGLIATGVLLYWRIGHSWSGLLTSDYGRLVLVKAGLVVPVLAMAGWNRFRLVPRIVGRSDRAAGGTLRRVVVAEAAVIAGVLAATSILITQSPPAPKVEPVVPEHELALKLTDDTTAEVVITPGTRGVNAVELHLVDEQGRPVTVVDPPTLDVRMESPKIGPFDHPLSPTGPGRWTATADFPLPGTWTVTVSARLSTFTEPVVSGTVVIP